METIWWSEVPSDFGTFGLASTGRGLLALLLPNSLHQRDRTLRSLVGDFEILSDDGRNAGAERQLREYLAGERQEFDLTLDQRGTTFQIAVWDAVYEVPWGQTTSYGEIARRIGRPEAVRAVGAANGANPHPIIVPCHRIIGADGSLTGYGGGLDLKKRLLAHEGIPVEPGPAYRTRSLFEETPAGA